MISNCNCAKKIECGCVLSFSSYVTHSLSVLDVGELVAAECVKYGLLYNWYAATDVRNIAPAGWHVPTNAEFSTLKTTVGSNPGGHLKETGTIFWNSQSAGCDNSAMFYGRGAGRRLNDGSFGNFKDIVNLWSSTESYGSPLTEAYKSYLTNLSDDYFVGLYGSPKKEGLTIRLLKDDSTDTGTMTGNDGKIYPTVTIGTQVWMAADLAETEYRNGDAIPEVTDNAAWAALETGALCAYENDWDNVEDDCGCTIDDYVIDWYKDGVYYMTSASSTGLVVPEATAFHPFTGLAAIPVEPGTFVPVIRFIIIGGEIIWTEPKPCQKWCDMTINLPEIVVTALSCETTGGTPPVNYSYKIEYKNTEDWTLSARNMRFYLPDDLSTLYVAFYFYAKDVADRIDVYFKDSTTALASYIVGTRFNPMQVLTPPYKINQEYTKFIIELPEYVSGDYLKIVITPSVLEPTNQLTDWWLALQCLNEDFSNECSAGEEIANYVWAKERRDYDVADFSFTQDAHSCRWKFNFKTTNTITPDSLFPTLYKYSDIKWGTYNLDIYNTVNREGWDGFSYGRLVVYGWDLGTSQAFYTSPRMTVSKSGNVMRFTYTGATQFGYLYDRHQAMMAGTWWSERSTDNTKYAYYRWFRIDIRYSTVGCGDPAYTSKSYYFHWSDTVTFGVDGSGYNYMEITTQSITNNLTPLASCDFGYADVTAWCNNNNSTFALADFSADTVCICTTPNLYYHNGYVDTFETHEYMGLYHYLHVKESVPYHALMTNWCQTMNYFTFFYVWFDVYITDITNPANNFYVTNGLNRDTGCIIRDLEEVYRIP